jgi:glycosyltransferase involved in cell wall biosynthesis
LSFDQPQPRVTFVVTNHNYARFLPQAIDSLLGQSVSDLELIVVDDCSTDDSLAVLERYAGDPRVQIVRHTTNTGSIRGYNEGLQMARGEFIGVFDADDYALDPEAVARQVAIFDAHPEVGLVYSAFDQVDEYSQAFRACRPFSADYVRDGLAEFSDLIFLNYIAHSGTLVRRTCHEALGYYDPRLPYAGDWELWLRVAARYAVGYIAAPLYAYRVHINNMTAKGKSPAEATGERLMAVERAFNESLPEDAPDSVRRLKPEALRRALLCGSWNDRSLGRVGRSWEGLLDAVRRSPVLLAHPAPYSAAAKLALLATLGHRRYERLSAQRSA